MTNIYDFPSRKAEAKEDGFLQQGSDTLAFDESGKHVDFSDKVYQSIERSRAYESANWSNQELASIYRVKCLLDAAKVPCTVERGQSDEGDPWCVYCTPGGEVFIHLCRISGTYILDSPNLSAPISGANFTQLIERFSNGALQKSRESNGQKHRVVRLSRGDNVFLHPATMLAALIWSIYVESEDLVLLSQDEEQEEPSRDDAILQVNSLAETPSAHELLNEAAFTNGHASDTDLMIGRLPDHLDAGEMALAVGADYAPQRDMTGKNGLFPPQTVIATGLSAIAVAVGLLSDSFIDRQPDAEMADLLARLPDANGDEALLANAGNPDKAKGLDLAAVVTSFFDHLVPEAEAYASVLADEIAADTAPAAPESILSADAMTLLAELADSLRAQIDPAATGPAPAETVELADLLVDLPATEDSTTTLPTPTPQVAAATDALSGFIDNALQLTGLQNIFDDMLQQYALGGTVFEASFDIAAIDETEASALERLLPAETDADRTAPVREENGAASAPPAPQQPGDDRFAFELFDDNVRKFVNHLLDKSEKVEMIATESELIFIDFAAFDEIGDESLTMSWSLSDGGTVSVVGLESEFQDFDLIVA